MWNVAAFHCLCIIGNKYLGGFGLFVGKNKTFDVLEKVMGIFEKAFWCYSPNEDLDFLKDFTLKEKKKLAWTRDTNFAN